MTEQTQKPAGDIWSLIFLIVPAVVFYLLSNQIVDGGTMQIVLAGVLGAGGALLGSFVYRAIKTRPVGVKVAALAAVLGVAVVGNLVLTPSLSTCDMCGYKAVQSVEHGCQVCLNDVWEGKV